MWPGPYVQQQGLGPLFAANGFVTGTVTAGFAAVSVWVFACLDGGPVSSSPEEPAMADKCQRNKKGYGNDWDDCMNMRTIAATTGGAHNDRGRNVSKIRLHVLRLWQKGLRTDGCAAIMANIGKAGTQDEMCVHDNMGKTRMQMTINRGKARMHKW